MKESIAVGYSEVNGMSGIYHKTIIYTDKNGNQTTYEVIPQISSDNGGRLPENLSNLSTGLLTETGLIDNPYGNMHSTVSNQSFKGATETIVTADDLSTQMSDIQKAFDSYNKEPYKPYTNNSNGAVDRALEKAGLPLPQQDGFSYSETLPHQTPYPFKYGV